jgi:hypothetical protein
VHPQKPLLLHWLILDFYRQPSSSSPTASGRQGLVGERNLPVLFVVGYVLLYVTACYPSDAPLSSSTREWLTSTATPRSGRGYKDCRACPISGAVTVVTILGIIYFQMENFVCLCFLVAAPAASYAASDGSDATAHVRALGLEGAPNFRDIGGYATRMDSTCDGVKCIARASYRN